MFKTNMISKKLQKGGETMRKALLLTAIAGLLISTAAFAQNPMVTTYTQTLYPSPDGGYGENWISLKGVPLQPDPLGTYDADTGALIEAGVFWQGDYDPTFALIDGGRLMKYNAVMGGVDGYQSYDAGAFGKCLLGDGYLVQVMDGTQHSISYNGIIDGVPSDPANPTTTMTDMWVSLPGQNGQQGGEHWIGNPFNHQVFYNDIKVTDGTVTLPLFDYDPAVDTAVGRGWIEKGWLYQIGSVQGVETTDPEGINGSWNLWPGHMYIVRTHKSNLALIIPAKVSEIPDDRAE